MPPLTKTQGGADACPGLLDAAPSGLNLAPFGSDPFGCPRWGRWLENACLAHAWNAGQEVYYWRAEPWEVDGILVGSWGRWIGEVKTGRYAAADLKGLAVASTKFPDFSPLVVCDPGEDKPAEAAGFRAITWPDYLLGGLRNPAQTRG